MQRYQYSRMLIVLLPFIIPGSLKAQAEKVRVNPDRSIPLKEVVIRATNALTLVRKAIAKIPVNYSPEKFSMVGLYRETARLDSGYLSFAEATLSVQHAGYSARLHKNSIRCLQEHCLERVGRHEVKNPFPTSLKGLPYTLLANDLIGSPGAVLSLNLLENYDFEWSGSCMINGEEADIVSFDQKDEVRAALYQGTIVIAKATSAVVDIRLSLSAKGISYAEPDIPGVLRPVLRLMGYRFQKLGETLHAIYVKKENWYYPARFLISTAHFIQARKQHLQGKLTITAEMVVADIDRHPPEKIDPALIMPENYVFKNRALNDQRYWDTFDQSFSELTKAASWSMEK